MLITNFHTNKKNDNHVNHHKDEFLKQLFLFKTINCKGKTNNKTKKTTENNKIVIEKQIINNEQYNNIKIKSSGDRSGYLLITDKYTRYGYGIIPSPTKYYHNNDIIKFILNKIFDFKSMYSLFHITHAKHQMTFKHKTSNLIVKIFFDHKSHDKVVLIQVSGIFNEKQEELDMEFSDIRILS